MKTIQHILLVDDHPLIRHGLRLLLTTLGYKVSECKNGSEALAFLHSNKVDAVVLDVDMPVMNGIEVAKAIRSNEWDIYIVYLTSHANFNTFSQAFNTEFDGFIFKETAAQEILNCFDTIKNGERFIGPNCQKFYMEHKEKMNNLNLLRDKLRLLSNTEMEVLQQIAQRKTTPQIAEIFFNSEKTIENHRYNICQKLDIKGSNNLLAFALENRELILMD